MIQDNTQKLVDDIAGQNPHCELTELEMLEELVVDNPDLERLESLVDQFNIFEAIGMDKQEIRHSFFLAFLLNPNESHGLGDIFLKRLLQKGTQLMPSDSKHSLSLLINSKFAYISHTK